MKREKWAQSDQAFGLLFAFLFFVFGFKKFLQYAEISYFLLLSAILFFLVSLLCPRIFSPLKKVWLRFGEFLGKIIQPLILVVLFYFCVSGVGAIMKLFRSAKSTTLPVQSRSNWSKREESSMLDFRKQF